jgi:predicted GNAT family acetyltransferase
MELRRFSSVGAFVALAGEFLQAREAEHNLILGICFNLQMTPEVYPDRPYLGVVVDRGHVVVAAIQTPPYNLVLSETDEVGAIETLLDDLAGEAIPGVDGPQGTAAAFAAGWSQRTGAPVRLSMQERIFRLGAVAPPRPANGGMRAAATNDRDLVAQWLDAFMTEALPGEAQIGVEQMADRWIAGHHRTLQLWVVDDEPVSMAGVGARTPNGVRIGPVYTPPDRRNRGYASSLVAGAAQAELDHGRTFVFLFTDLANPTSNHIYQAIGFEPVSDVDRYAFG